ncbi:MAG: orotidine-5'-phosphate decarboxylase [Patescibacteria group bacterium]|nr:orotidine-5'-phosphate decarboxylase [Patescibacteria group bacterium]
MKDSFISAIRKNWKKKKTMVCVGLDSEYSKIPQFLKNKYFSCEKTILEFNKAIIKNTFDLVCCYKIQYAFYGALGEEGISALRKTIEYIHERHPEIPVILDAKRNDIGNTSEAYAVEVFDNFGADAATINPYLGKDSCEPFLERKDKGVILLCRTSNLGAGDFQDLITNFNGKKMPLYQVVATKISRDWNRNGNCCLVMGATYPKQLKIVRNITGDMPFLVPGIGSQGGYLENTIKNGIDSKGAGLIINSSRGIIFASNDKDFARKAREEAIKLKRDIDKYRYN